MTLPLLLALLAGPVVPAGAQPEPHTKSKVYMVSNAHLDTQWNWDVRTTINEYVPATMRRNFSLFEKYPEYVFNFEGGIKYAWMKEYYPAEYELVRRYIAEGRWHVTGSTWDATDPNMPSPESFTRNILYGQHFYEQEFGVRGTDIFLPDCFGFGLTLPSIAAHCGLIGFSTQKLQWRNLPFYGDRKTPFPIGLWQGIDGSRIMIADDAHKYSQKYRFHDLTADDELQSMVEDSGLGVAYRYYGVGDRGGSPEFETVRTVMASLHGEGPLELISATSDQIYKDYLPFESHPELPVWKGELLMDVHATGCYTSQAAMKFFNRRNEQLADAAERGSVAAEWLGAAVYPQQELTTAWKRFIWHQFHDDLTGTSIPRACEFSWNDELLCLNEFSGIVTSSAAAVAASMDTRVKGAPVVLYNPLARTVSDVVTIDAASLGLKAGSFSVYDAEGRKVPSQFKDGRLTFAATVPSVGYAVYDVRKGGVDRRNAVISASGEGVLENSVYRVTLDANGDMSSIVDKRSGRELVADGRAVRLALFTGNKSAKWPAWEILRPVMEAEAQPVTGDVRISVVENGPVRASLRVERRFGSSSFAQVISLSEGAHADRIDVFNDIDWHESGVLLKAEFPLGVSNPEATYDLGLGAIARSNNTDTKYEVYAAQWADLTDADGSHGVSVLNDCKYGWDKPADNVIRLTLLHTPETESRYTYQNAQDHGRHTFTYSLVSHEGDWRQGGAVAAAELLNQPVKAFASPRHAGRLGRSFSFASTDDGCLAVRAIKKAENGDGYVVRVYETAGLGSRSGSVRFASAVVSAECLNGNEDVLETVVPVNGALPVEIGPFGIRTYRVRLADAGAAGLSGTPVDLPFNVRAATYNAFRSDADFDGQGNSFAAELLPSTLDCDNVCFVLGDPAAPDAVRCEAQELTLPSDAGGVLYLLCCSGNGDVTASFRAGSTECLVNVPYYGGFFGQWGHTGHTEDYVKDARVAYVGTHRHSSAGNEDLAYDFSYLFSVPVSVPAGTQTVVLPDDARVNVFAASFVSGGIPALTPCVNMAKGVSSVF